MVSALSGVCRHLRLIKVHILGSGLKHCGACESPEAPAPKHVHWNTAPSDDLEDLALMSGLIKDIKGAVVEAGLTWRKVEDKIWVVEDWERGLRRRLREN